MTFAQEIRIILTLKHMQCVHAAALEVFQIYSAMNATKWLEKYSKGFYSFSS